MAFFITQDCTGCGVCKRICPCSAIDGEKKELHQVIPKLCIDCNTCGRICPFGAVEDNFGAAVKPIKKQSWPKPDFDEKVCMSCGLCVDACPAGVISTVLKVKKDPHPYPFLQDEKGCLGCAFCEKECPVDAIMMVQPVIETV